MADDKKFSNIRENLKESKTKIGWYILAVIMVLLSVLFLVLTVKSDFTNNSIVKTVFSNSTSSYEDNSVINEEINTEEISLNNMSDLLTTTQKSFYEMYNQIKNETSKEKRAELMPKLDELKKELTNKRIDFTTQLKKVNKLKLSVAKTEEEKKEILDSIKEYNRNLNNQMRESFSNDLPNNNVSLDNEVSYNDILQSMALEPEVISQHKEYLTDKSKSTNTASFLPSRSDSQTVVPFVGLRRPQYLINNKDLVDESARTVPSELDADQLDRPVKISWS